VKLTDTWDAWDEPLAVDVRGTDPDDDWGFRVFLERGLLRLVIVLLLVVALVQVVKDAAPTAAALMHEVTRALDAATR
jgi:hypothetical protein